MAYAVARAAEAPPADDLKSFLRAALPEYMVPSRFVFLDALPLTPNGKVDRRALPATDLSVAANGRQFIDARDDLERRLKEIWERLLEVQNISVTDNYFDLGGHSLLIARLSQRIQQEFGQQLSMAEVFQTPTIEGMAGLLRKAGLSAAECKVFPIQPSGSRPPFICLGAGPFFLPLANAVGHDQPFCGLDLESLRADRLAAPYQLEEIGVHVKNAVRKFQPRGPYYLGGWCLFGVLMYEAARQMIAEGDQVGLLVMIDSPNKAYEKGLAKLGRFNSRLQSCNSTYRKWAGREPREIPNLLKNQLGNARAEARVQRERKEVSRNPAIVAPTRTLLRLPHRRAELRSSRI